MVVDERMAIGLPHSEIKSWRVFGSVLLSKTVVWDSFLDTRLNTRSTTQRRTTISTLNRAIHDDMNEALKEINA